MKKLCICGHEEEAHDRTGACTEPGCLCCGYEEDEDNEDNDFAHQGLTTP